jgi:hypothetical protein
MVNLSEFLAIDPLALVLPSSVYVKLVEKLHPHVPSIAEIREAARALGAEERRFAVARAQQIAAYAKVVEEGLAT